ncbi:formate transporter FocA [Ferrimonas pelagia]|uniref:Formate transporter FocA n=1 Tax=Ferrimonas pelagia TaxID=1177826 RepID=A0ABP9EV99_9GAMM
MLKAVPSAKPQDPLYQQAVKTGHSKLAKSASQRFALSVMAGVFIGLAFTFYITALTGADNVPWGISRLLGGLVFSLGLILVVICGAELFTSTVLTVIPWAKRQISGTRMLKHWGLVFAGNCVGALLLVALLWVAKQHLAAGGDWGIKLMSVAQYKLKHDFSQAVALGALCNLLVCLGIWMSYSAKEPASKALLLILPVAMFVSAGFEHSIANLFLVPMAIAIHSLADASFWAATGMQPDLFASLTTRNFVLHNLIPVTIGNIIGGALFVGLGQWWIHGQTAEKNTHKFLKGKMTMTKHTEKMNVAELINTQPMMVPAEALISDVALQLLTEGGSAALVMEAGQAKGLVDEQDLLRGYYLAEEQERVNVTVADVMQPICFQAKANESVASLALRLAVDEDQMHPVSSSGFLLRHSELDLNSRAQQATPSANTLTLVLDGDQVIGVVEKRRVLAALAGITGSKAATQNETVAPAEIAVA